MAEADIQVKNGIIGVLNNNTEYTSTTPEAIQKAQAEFNRFIDIVKKDPDDGKLDYSNHPESIALITTVRDDFKRFNEAWDAYIPTLTLPRDTTETEKKAALREALDEIVAGNLTVSPLVASLIPEVDSKAWHCIITQLTNRAYDTNPEGGKEKIGAMIVDFQSEQIDENSRLKSIEFMQIVQNNFETYNKAFDAYVATLSLPTDPTEKKAALRQAATRVLVTTGGETAEPLPASKTSVVLAEGDGWLMLGSALLGSVTAGYNGIFPASTPEVSDEEGGTQENPNSALLPAAINLSPRLGYNFFFHGLPRGFTPDQKRSLSIKYELTGWSHLASQLIPLATNTSANPIAEPETEYIILPTGEILPTTAIDYFTNDAGGRTLDAWFLANLQKRRLAVSQTSLTPKNPVVGSLIQLGLDYALNTYTTIQLHRVNGEIKATATVYYPDKEKIDSFRQYMEEQGGELEEWTNGQSNEDLAYILTLASQIEPEQVDALCYNDEYESLDIEELCDRTEGDTVLLGAIIGGATETTYYQPFPSLDIGMEAMEQSGLLTAMANGSLVRHAHIWAMGSSNEQRIPFMLLGSGAQVALDYGVAHQLGQEWDTNFWLLKGGTEALTLGEAILANGDEELLVRYGTANAMIATSWNRPYFNAVMSPHLNPDTSGGIFPYAFYGIANGIGGINTFLGGMDAGDSLYVATHTSDPQQKSGHAGAFALEGVSVVIGWGRAFDLTSSAKPFTTPDYNEQQVQDFQEDLKENQPWVIGGEVASTALWGSGVGISYGLAAKRGSSSYYLASATLPVSRPLEYGHGGFATVGGVFHTGKNNRGIDYTFRPLIGNQAIMPTQPNDPQLGLHLTVFEGANIHLLRR